MADLELFGFLFESMVIRDLRIYAQAADAEVFHYRGKDGMVHRSDPPVSPDP